MFVFALNFGCQKARPNALQISTKTPQRVMIGEPASADWGIYLTDDKGRPRQRLVLSLDIMNASVDQLPTCQKPLDEQFELGHYRCTDPESPNEQSLLAGHVEQLCYTVPGSKAQGPVTALSVQGCKSIVLKGFIFDPPLRVDAESRELQ